jgi:hypothetical protein
MSNIGLDYGEPEWTSRKAAQQDEARQAELEDTFLDTQRELAKSHEAATDALWNARQEADVLAGEFLHRMAKLRMNGAKPAEISAAMTSLYERTVARMTGDENWEQY